MHPKTIQNGFFLVLLALTTFAFLGLIEDFLLPVFWAAVLATLFFPLQVYLTRRLGERPSPAAVLTLLVILLVVILPLFLVGLAVARQSLALYERVVAGEIGPQDALNYIEQTLPAATGYMERLGMDLDRLREGLSSAAVNITQFLATQALVIGQNALRIGGLFFLMVYVLFFFLRDGEQVVDALIWALPLGDVRERRLLERFAEVSRATIKGTIAVGAAQGILGGLFFWILGLPAPVFWGVVMALASLIPAVGAALVWGPAVIILFVTGEVAKGLILIAAGVLVISMVDNLLRPILVGRDTQMPDYLILLATLGGLAVFGLSGVVLGPMIAAFFLAVWEMFAEEYAEKSHAEAVDDAASEPDAVEEAAPPEEAVPHG